MFVSSHERVGEGKVEYFLHTAMAPLENFFHQTGKISADSWNTISRLSRLKADNDKLRREIGVLKTKQLELSATKSENRRLRASLGFVAEQPHQLIAAEIIAVNPTNFNQTIIINKGRDSGIKKTMAVITPEGVVGRISEVHSNTAEIITITDPRQGNIIGGVVSRTRNMVIVSGGGLQRGTCTVQPAGDSYFIDLKKKDRIFTAETSDIFPRGLPIGRIVTISKEPKKMIYQAHLKPAVNFNRLNMVYVIKVKKDLPLPLVETEPTASKSPVTTPNPGGNGSAPANH